MSKITLALGSFMLGVLCMSLLGNQTSTLAQQAQPTPRPPIHFMNMRAWVPVVPPIGNRKMERLTLSGGGMIYDVDGMRCEGCAISDVTITYGGGDFALINTAISRPVRIDLEGAARNTAIFLNMFGLLGCHVNKPPAPNVPQIMEAQYIIPTSGTNNFMSATTTERK